MTLCGTIENYHYFRWYKTTTSKISLNFLRSENFRGFHKPSATHNTNNAKARSNAEYQRKTKGFFLGFHFNTH